MSAGLESTRAGGEAAARLQAALEDRVAAGAPGALARIDAPGLSWAGAAGSRGDDQGPLRPEHGFRIASVTKSITATTAIALAGRGDLQLDAPLDGQLERPLLCRWSALPSLAQITPRQLLAHRSGLPDYFDDPGFVARLKRDPRRRWQPVELVDHVAGRGATLFPPGEGFSYSDTGYVLVGLLLEQLADAPLERIFRELVLDPLAMNRTWLEGREPARAEVVAESYRDQTPMSTLTPTVDWAGGGLVSTTADLARFVHGLWSGVVLDERGLRELTRWSPDARFPEGHRLRYDRYGLGLGSIVVEGVELLGHTGFIGAFAFRAPELDAVLTGSHNASAVDRWPLVAAICRELRASA